MGAPAGFDPRDSLGVELQQGRVAQPYGHHLELQHRGQAEALELLRGSAQREDPKRRDASHGARVLVRFERFEAERRIAPSLEQRIHRTGGRAGGRRRRQACLDPAPARSQRRDPGDSGLGGRLEGLERKRIWIGELRPSAEEQPPEDPDGQERRNAPEPPAG